MKMRTLIPALALLLLATPAAAQHEHGGHGGHDATHPNPGLPDGWSARVDRDAPVADIMFMEHGEGFHAVTGPAAVLYDTDWTESGDYEVSARFVQNTAPEHPESYGIVIGGTDLDGPAQAYTYFLVRGTGEYFVAVRSGDERTIVVPWTAHEAVAAQDDAGRQTNTLGARVAGDVVVFTANGTEVARLPKSDLHTDGVFGFRVNHRLDVFIDEVSR